MLQVSEQVEDNLTYNDAEVPVACTAKLQVETAGVDEGLTNFCILK